MSKVTTLPLCDLVEDLQVYPRHAVDDVHVVNLVRALESGVTLPPIVADKLSKRIVDGWHRYRAHRRVLGPGGVIDVELRPYPDEASLLLDAVAMNSAHGRRLDSIDQTRAVVMLDRHKVPSVRIAVVLHVPERHMEKLRVRIARAERPSEDTVTGTRIVTLKRPVAHMQGTKLTDEQVKVHGTLPGTSFLLLAKQLTDALRVKMVNLEDDKLMDELKKLKEELLKLFP